MYYIASITQADAEQVPIIAKLDRTKLNKSQENGYDLLQRMP